MYELLLLLAAANCVYSATSGRSQYARFAKLKTSAKRLGRYRTWLAQSWIFLGLFAVLAMLIAGQSAHLLHPPVSRSLSGLLGPLQNDPDAISGLITGAVTGFGVVVALVIIRARQGKSVPSIGNYAALLPRNPTERGYGIGLALTAAVTEELFFRAMLPVLILGVSHNVQLAVWGSVLLFASCHYYQGWQGLLGTFVLGFILMQLFLFSGTILAPMAAHAFIDLNSLVTLPALSMAARKRA